MFWRWKWNKEKNQSEPEYKVSIGSFSIRELIATTIRNRHFKYYDEKLDIPNLDTIIEEIQTEYEKWYSGVSDNRTAIDGLVSICEKYETLMRIGTKKSIKEYGK